MATSPLLSATGGPTIWPPTLTLHAGGQGWPGEQGTNGYAETTPAWATRIWSPLRLARAGWKRGGGGGAGDHRIRRTHAGLGHEDLVTAQARARGLDPRRGRGRRVDAPGDLLG